LKRKAKNDENFEGKTNFVFSEILQKKERKKEKFVFPSKKMILVFRLNSFHQSKRG
jgi:hypothetical protein